MNLVFSRYNCLFFFRFLYLFSLLESLVIVLIEEGTVLFLIEGVGAQIKIKFLSAACSRYKTSLNNPGCC